MLISSGSGLTIQLFLGQRLFLPIATSRRPLLEVFASISGCDAREADYALLRTDYWCVAGR